MKSLKEEQRKMRERMKASKPKIKKADVSIPVQLDGTSEVETLLKRIAELELENAELQRRISALESQTPPRPPSVESNERERRHMFMKYSNVRRY